MQQGLCNDMVSVRPSVCPSCWPLKQRVAGLLLWARQVGRNVRRILVREGQCPLGTWGEENFRKFDYEMVHSEVYLNICGQHSAVLYTCLPWLLSKYNIYIENCSFLHVFAFWFFIHFSRGAADPICPYVQTPLQAGDIDRLLHGWRPAATAKQRHSTQQQTLTAPWLQPLSNGEHRRGKQVIAPVAARRYAPADGSSTRGGSTSVCGRVCTPHTSGGWQWLSCRQPACL